MKNHKGKILAMMVCAVMFTAVFAVAVPENARAATITVPDDYPTIQLAIDAASPGEEVYVRAGTYYEHVTIGKSLTLQGEDRETTIIDCSGPSNVVNVTSSYVTVRGFTITNSGSSTPEDAGIVLHSVSNNTIADNNIYSNNGKLSVLK